MNAPAVSPDTPLDGIIIGRGRMYSLGPVLSSPLPSRGVLYVGSTGASLYALE